MKIHIKYMVSLRCKIMVEEILKKMGLHTISVELGEVVIFETILSPEQREQLKKLLFKLGLELIDDHKDILIEKIKKVVIEMIHYENEMPTINYSSYISRKLGYSYTYLANVFSEIKGISIQQFIINNKIEKVKELLSYQELTITEISYQLHYSGVAHLSNQFKKVTGFTPTFFKQSKGKQLANLESL